MSETITLRYFNARGRAQFIRYFLRVRNTDFVDERIPLEADFSSWMAVRDDTSRTGPFHKLPVMEIDGLQLAETSVITNYLHERFGDSVALREKADLQHRQLMSALNDDVTMAVGLMLWAEVMFQGVDFPAYVKRTFDRLGTALINLERVLVDWRWLEESNLRPIMLADCRLWESIDVCRTVFGDALSFGELPVLEEIHRRYASRTAFSEMLAEHPCPITARDNEPEVIERVQAILRP